MSKSPVRTMYVYLYRLKRSMGGYKRGEGYVGQAVDPVKRDKQHSNAKNARNFERVLRELGRENFSFNVVAQCECWPHGPKINALENEMMAKCGTFRRESGRGWNFSRANSYELGSVEQLESVHAARKAANQRKAKDPKWLAANKAANQRKAKDPKWLERNRAQNCRTMQDPKWQSALIAGHQRMRRDPKWLAANKAANRRKAKDPKWLAKMASRRRRYDYNQFVEIYTKTGSVREVMKATGASHIFIWYILRQRGVWKGRRRGVRQVAA